MSSLFDRYSGEAKLGKEITIGNCFPEIFVSDHDEVFCYAGICLNDQEEALLRGLFCQPYYMAGKHSTDRDIAKKIRKFYRLSEGGILLDDYVDNQFGERTYKQIRASVRFPAADTYYGVLVEHQEDEKLTQGVFGLTYKELSHVLEKYAMVLGTFNEYLQYPRQTRSVRSSNSCDLTDAWLPEQFPYITFAESGYDFSHISLSGFYRHLQLLTNRSLSSTVSRALLKAGVDEQILLRMLNLNCSLDHQIRSFGYSIHPAY